MSTQDKRSAVLKDRQFFFVQVKSDIRFLFAHIPFFMNTVCMKIGNIFKLKRNSKHQGTKSWPPFLPEKKNTFVIEPHQNGYLHLPDLKIRENVNCICEQGIGLVTSKKSDSESYFMENRWSYLLSEPLDGSSDVIKAVHDWRLEHSDKANDAAWEPYSCCERLAHLLTYLAAASSTKNRIHQSVEVVSFIEESLAWIYHHLEYYGPKHTNNHLLNNARALVIGGVAIDHRLSVETGMHLFYKCLPMMIMPQGMLRERSSHYQLIVLNWVLDTLSFLKSYDKVSHDDVLFLQNYVDKMAKSTAYLCDEHGDCLSLIGDVSPDMSPRKASCRLKVLYPSYWPYTESPTLPASYVDGWFRLQDGKSVVLGNFPSGVFPFDFPTHGHGDFCGFSWLYHSHPILLDLGRYRYTSDAVSTMQKNAEGHNIPLVQGFSPISESLAKVGERYPTPYACAELSGHLCEQGVSVKHTGFSRSTPVLSHERLISLQDYGLKVSDIFLGEGKVDLDFLWHFGSGFCCSNQDNLCLMNEDMKLEMHFINVTTKQQIRPNAVDCLSSDRSLEYGIKDTCHGLRIRFDAHLPFSIETYFTLGDLCVE